MRIRLLLSTILILFTHLLCASTVSRSKIADIGRVIYSSDEALLLTKLQSFEAHTNVAVKIVTTFRLYRNYDVSVVYTTELTGDNTIVIVVQTGFWSSLTEDYEPGRFRDDLHTDRTANLNRENLLTPYSLEEIRKRMIDRFYEAGHSEDSKNLYESLDLGIETLSLLIHNPVAVRGSLIWESAWNRPDPYILPELAGFIDGGYSTLKGIPALDNALNQATEVARSLAFNYTFNIDGYRTALNEMVSEVATNLDTYIQLANTLVAAENRLVNIYRGTSMEDRYWRGIIAFEVAGALFPISKTKVATKTASGLRGLLNDFRNIKVSGIAMGADVPTGLVSKLTQQGSAKLKSWLSSKTLSYADNTGAKFSGTAAETKIFSDLDAAIGNKRVLETLEDGQGRLSVVLERPGQTNQVVSIHPTSAGDFKMTTFEPAYNPSLNPNIPAPASANRLVPDYAGTQYLHPLNQGRVIKIKMTGKRTGSTGDFALADAEVKKLYPNFTKPEDYTWHHLDDFNPTTGECTMQLVKSSAHQGAGVQGMAHSGSVAQWKAYYGSSSNAPSGLFYQQ